MIDVIGVGSDVYDRCRELHLPVRRINVGEDAASRENCARLRDELWLKGREWFQDRACSMPKDDALIARPRSANEPQERRVTDRTVTARPAPIAGESHDGEAWR
jgi:hypothetical protein